MPFQLLRPRSTGRWDITGSTSGVTSGQLIVEREGDTVWLDFQEIQIESPGGFISFDFLLPGGLQPPTRHVDLPIQGRGAADVAGPVRVTDNGTLTIYNPRGTIRGLVSFRTAQAMITTVPGGVKL